MHSNAPFNLIVYILLGDDDPSIDRLVAHFNAVIHNILRGTWKHFASTATIKSRNENKVHGFYLKNLSGCLTYDAFPRPVWLGRHGLQAKIKSIHDKVNLDILYVYCSNRCVRASLNLTIMRPRLY